MYVSVAGSCSLVDSKPLLSALCTFHCSSRCTRWLNRNKTMVVTKQVQSLLSTFEHFTNNIVNVRCYVLNQTTVVPKYYVYMANVSVTFCYTGSFIGNQTYAPLFSCLCVYVKCTSFKLCVYEYERLCNHTNRKQWIIIIFGGIRWCSFKLCCILSCPCHSFADFHGVNNLRYYFDLKAQAYHRLLPDKSQCSVMTSSHFTHYTPAALTSDTRTRRCTLTSLLTWDTAWFPRIRATPIR